MNPQGCSRLPMADWGAVTEVHDCSPTAPTRSLLHPCPPVRAPPGQPRAGGVQGLGEASRSGC